MAAQHASSLGPAVAEVVNKAADGTYLLPKQERFMFYGLHAMAAARANAIYQPLMRLLRRPSHEVERLMGDATTASLARIALSVFDGDAGPLIAVIEDRSVDGFVRWGLFDALARLTFDGAVPASETRAVIDRFERGNLAPNGDPAWQGWQSAIMLLGLADRAERVRAAWRDGRNPERDVDQEDWEERLAAAAADPSNADRFVEAGLVPIDDPVEALAWTAKDDESAARRGGAEAEFERGDPAAAGALDDEEIDWLGGFLECPAVPDTAMSIEELDGFFTALVVGPETILPSEYMPEIWGSRDGGGPAYDGLEQAQHVLGLLMRHWNSIASRLASRYPHIPFIAERRDGQDGGEWARGFLRGVRLRPDSWRPLIEDEQVYRLLGAVALLDVDNPDLIDSPETLERRQRIIERLPLAIRGMHGYWRKPHRRRPTESGPVRHRKIGRNEPCPCGSGKKYKFCCGSTAGSSPR